MPLTVTSGERTSCSSVSVVSDGLHSRPFFVELNCGTKVLFAVPLGDSCSKELLGKCCDGNRHVLRLCRFKSQAHILVHPFCRKIRSEIPIQNGGTLGGR